MMVANVVAVVLALPLLIVLGLVSYGAGSFAGLSLGIALLVGVLPNPVMSGLQFVARELANGDIVMLSDQWDGFRRYWAITLRAWLLSVAVTIVIVANITFYASAGLPPLLSVPLRLAWLYVLLLWLAIHLYVFPLLLEQEVKRIVLAYRNALVMTVSRPGFAVVVAPLWLLLLSLASATGLVTIIGLALGAAIQQTAAARLLPTFPTSSAESE